MQLSGTEALHTASRPHEKILRKESICSENSRAAQLAMSKE